MKTSADSEQTPKGFPSQNRPQVLATFFKNGHRYTKDYQLNAKSLGAETMRWWEGIKGSVGFGGPTGIYTLVVLVSWWCTLLKGQPNGELADCLRALEDINAVFLSVIRNMNNERPTTLSSTRSSPVAPPVAPPALTTPVPQLRGSKRNVTEEAMPRKRSRLGMA